jgi:hypothetical protein
METFLLVAWIYAGDGQFEQLRRPELSSLQCYSQAIGIIHRALGLVAMCINETRFEPAWTPHRGPFGPAPVCAHDACGPLAGRKRV